MIIPLKCENFPPWKTDKRILKFYILVQFFPLRMQYWDIRKVKSSISSFVYEKKNFTTFHKNRSQVCFRSDLKTSEALKTSFSNTFSEFAFSVFEITVGNPRWGKTIHTPTMNTCIGERLRSELKPHRNATITLRISTVDLFYATVLGYTEIAHWMHLGNHFTQNILKPNKCTTTREAIYKALFKYGK